jgi:hypothetical protein
VRQTRHINSGSPARVSTTEYRASPIRREPISFEQSSSVLRDNKFRNPQLEAATAQIEQEFNRLLAEGPQRQPAPSSPIKKDDDFYKLMGDFYQSSPDLHRHASPTKRLIQQKNSTWTHKEQMQQHCPRT